MTEVSEDGTMVWVDLEMTGLNPVEDMILEVGFRITDWDGGDEVARFTSLVHSPGWRERLSLGENRPAFEIHTENGLIADLEGAGPDEVPDVRETESLIIAWLDSYKILVGLPLAGSSNHLDRYFLIRHMPELANRFTYRTQDISAVREFMRITSPDLRRRLDDDFKEAGKRHRPQADIDDAIAMYQWIIDNYLSI